MYSAAWTPPTIVSVTVSFISRFIPRYRLDWLKHSTYRNNDPTRNSLRCTMHSENNSHRSMLSNAQHKGAESLYESAVHWRTTARRQLVRSRTVDNARLHSSQKRTWAVTAITKNRSAKLTRHPHHRQSLCHGFSVWREIISSVFLDRQTAPNTRLIVRNRC